MQTKLCLLFALLFVCIAYSKSADQKSSKDDSSVELKKKTFFDSKDYDDDEDDHDNRMKMKSKPKNKNYHDDDDQGIDDNYSALLGDSFSRYSSSNAGEKNYRTRSRWPSSSYSQSQDTDETQDANDWSRNSYSNNHPLLPPVSFDNRQPSNNNPTCYSLIDPQYTIFSDMCGAVPQARYSLPNSFGHRERWQIAQSLTSLMSSSSDPNCVRSLRLLLCPVLFPPCQARNEQPPTLPCQSFCRSVKSRCAIPALEFLPCEALPHSSDLCPASQTYSPFNPQPMLQTFPQQLPMTPGFPSFNYPAGRTFPSLQAILAQQTLQPGSASSPLNTQQAPQLALPLQTALNNPQAQHFAFQLPSALNNPQGQQLTFQLPTNLHNPQAQQLTLQMPTAMNNHQAQQLTLPLSAPLHAQQTPQLTLTAPAAQTQSHANAYNTQPYTADNFASMYADFAARPVHDYLQSSNYGPSTRSSNDVVPTGGNRVSSGSRTQIASRPTVGQSFVKA